MPFAQFQGRVDPHYLKLAVRSEEALQARHAKFVKRGERRALVLFPLFLVAVLAYVLLVMLELAAPEGLQSVSWAMFIGFGAGLVGLVWAMAPGESHTELTPLASTDDLCEQAARIIALYPKARAWRDAVVESGRQLRRFDLYVLQRIGFEERLDFFANRLRWSTEQDASARRAKCAALHKATEA